MSIKNGQTPAKDQYSVEPDETDVVIIKVANLTNRGLDFREESLSFVPKYVFEKAPRKARAQPGDVLVLCAAHQRKYIGKRADIIEALPLGYENRTMVVAELLILRAELNRIDPHYLLACLRLPLVQQLVNKYVRGQTGHLYPSDLQQLQIPVPEDLRIQRAIAQTVYRAGKEIERLTQQMLRVDRQASERLAEDIFEGLDRIPHKVDVPVFVRQSRESGQLSFFEGKEEDSAANARH